MTRLTVALLLTTLVLWKHSFAQLSDGIFFTPTTNQTVPFNSDDNITYECEVDGNRLLIWVVSGASIETDGNASPFEAIGVFKEDQGRNCSTLIITRRARDAYMREPISVRCSAFNRNPPGTDFSSFSYVVTYGVPNSPGNLMLIPSGIDLTLSWSPPTNVPPGVPVTYCVNITGAGANNRTCNITTTSFTFPEDDQAMCEMFQFSVTASNPAGESIPTIIQDTIPISADLRNASRELTIDYIDLTRGEEVFIQVSFPPARACNIRFPVTNYSVNVLGLGSVTVGNSNSDRIVIPVNTSAVSGLMQDRRYSLTVSACIEITCRESRETTTLNTTSVQNASLIFYETNVLMTCTFATRTPALGCVITLALSNASIPEQFFISQNETGSRQCNVTLNHENAYTITEAVDWESDGTEGSFPIPIEPLDLEDPNNFTALTECPLPTAPVASGGLTGGQIAGIVIGVLAAVAIIGAVIAVLGVAFYKERTGPWAKIKDMDDNNVEMKLDTSRLVGERKPKKPFPFRRKETSTQVDAPQASKANKKEPLLGSSPPPKSPVSPSSALPPQSEKTMAAGGPLPPPSPSPSGEQKSLGSPTSLEKGLHLTGPLPPPSASIVPRSPDSPTSLEKGLHLTGPLQPSTSIVEGQDSEDETAAFVLHILDNKKARLQVNKEALRTAIRRHSEKAMSSITQSKAMVKRSRTKQAKPKQPRGKYLLPLRSIVRVDTYDSDDQGDGDGQELTLIPSMSILKHPN